jgi:hypothetical protein
MLNRAASSRALSGARNSVAIDRHPRTSDAPAIPTRTTVIKSHLRTGLPVVNGIDTNLSDWRDCLSM